MQKENVKQLLDTALEQNPNLFLIDLQIKPANQILVVIDGDESVSVEDCMQISRAIEHNLDREKEDFSLEVTSAGATSPLLMSRQFKKNIGRKLEVHTENEKYEANLEAANEENITLRWKTREPKPVGKGKVTVKKEVILPYKEITEAKVKIKF
ncbi:ribosome assembly cofactor RimP [Haloflavibacter putidus]|uniref:Ribosome maturation factor RimP n=1 Tax=Haloflavibacter putidus TaxID=2576776 RepID=A0A507ZTM2_9FLAO|nr:ribosome assembly cofactor RimP [Haloflavibacter putidus]TQD39604.1 ribosome assembly cofactor RimP [Haloflavibacter putidus]